VCKVQSNKRIYRHPGKQSPTPTKRKHRRFSEIIGAPKLANQANKLATAPGRSPDRHKIKTISPPQTDEQIAVGPFRWTPSTDMPPRPGLP
jgi:beta-glucosidase-like glycosyl hydrolase